MKASRKEIPSFRQDGCCFCCSVKSSPFADLLRWYIKGSSGKENSSFKVSKFIIFKVSPGLRGAMWLFSVLYVFSYLLAMYAGAAVVLFVGGKKILWSLKNRRDSALISTGKVMGIFLFSFLTCIPILLKEQVDCVGCDGGHFGFLPFVKLAYIALERTFFLLLVLIYLKTKQRDWGSVCRENYLRDLLVCPLCEEMSFRLYLLHYLECNKYLMSFLFSISHCATSILYGDPLPMPQLMVTFGFALFIGDLFNRTLEDSNGGNALMSLLVCFASHSLCNFISFPSYMDVKDPIVYLCVLVSFVYFCWNQ